MNLPQVDFTFIYLFLFFAIPGLIFRKLYFQGEFSKQFISKNWAYTLSSSFVLGIIIQMVSFYGIKGYFTFYEKPSNSLYLFTFSDFIKLKNIITELSLYDFGKSDRYILFLLCYVVFTCLISFLLATISWQFVRKLKLDRKFKFFRFGNIWNYYLRGEIVDFKDFALIREEDKTVFLTLVDIVISDGFSENKLFSGVLSQYTINSKDNTLETVTLTDAHLWKKCNDKSSELYGKSYKKQVQGHCLILDVKKSLDLNITYVFKKNKNSALLDFFSQLIRFVTVLLYLIMFIYIIIASNSFLVGESIFITIPLKIYYIYILTLITSIIYNFFDYIENKLIWTKEEKQDKLKGGIIVLFFLIVSLVLHRLIVVI